MLRQSEQQAAPESSGGERSIAIVGIGCRFPGGVDGPESFWRLLRDGVDAIGEIPADRMDVEGLYDPTPATPGRIVSRRGGYLPKIDEFDAAFFGISPRQAERLDPQHRLLLETTWEAFEDAGIDIRALYGSAVGVFVGQWQSDFERRLFDEAEGVDFRMTTGSGRYASSGRVSYTFGFNGPSLTIDTACSSSLASVLVACRSLHAGESTLAVAGGVNIILEPHITIAYSQSRMMAADGACKFGDARADGYVRSEGCGMLLLKPLAAALAAGDRVYAVIRGGALNNDGRGSGSFGTPSREGQRALLRRAYADAGIERSRARYVEAHGAGTPAGDPVEFVALSDELGESRPGERRLIVGSVKTNVGHTEGAAGVAGLIKVALSLHHGAIPASLHLENPSSAIPWSSLPIDVPRALRPWPPGEGTRIAGVSGFGISGSNGHIVLEEAPTATTADGGRAALSASVPRAFALPISAQSPDALRAVAVAYADLLARSSAPAIRDFCMSAARLRTPLAARAVFIAEESSELIERLRRFAAGDAAAAQALGEALETVDRAHGGLAFVFPGQGPQWTGMGRELMAREPVFRDAIDACETAMVPYVDWSLREQLEADAGSPRSRMDDIAVIQPVLVAVEIALAALWRSWGVEPSAVVGHSMGEVGAAYVAGALTLDDAMRVICKRSALMRRTSGNGAMALIDLSPDDVERRLTPWAGRLSIAVHNAPHSTVVSGDPAALDALLATVEAEGTFNRRVKVDVASHSWQMEPLVPQLVAALDGITPRATSIDMYSTVTGSRISGAELGAVYWGRNLRERVQFKSAVEAAIAAGVETMVELSPHPALVSAIQQTATATGSAVTASGSLRRAEPEQAAMLAAAGGLWVSGYAIDWAKVMPGAFARTALPTYPWQRQRYWHPAAERVSGDARGRGSLAIKRPDDASLDALYTVRWEAAPVPTTGANATTVIIVDTRLEGDAAFTSALTSAFDARGTTVRRVEPDALANALSDSPTDTSLRETVVVCVAPRSERAAYVPVEIAQRALESSNGTAPRMWFMTRGAQAVSGAERVDPWQAALWGAARVVGEEHPELWGGLVDTGSDDDAELAVAAILAQDGEDQVAIRSGERFAARLVSYKPSGVSASLPWRDDGAYLITGGLGEIGLRIAASMVGAGARRIVLLGRTALPPRHEWGESTLVPDSLAGRRVAAIKSLEAKGASVHLLTADVGDEVELSKAIASYRAESWPAIRGVLHAAGALENRLIEDMDRATFDRVVGPKLRGALYLDRLFPDADVFVTFSSTGGFLAQPGQANYAAANAGLDAVVQDRRARGANALSIAWGVWAETGLVRDVAGARNVDEMRRQGVEPFSADEGVALFSWLLQRAEPVVTVLPMNWGKYRRARAGRESSIFRRQLEGITASDGEHGNDDVASQVARAASARERRELIDGVVRDAAARVLRIPANRIEPRRAFGSMGLDSLMALELRNRLVELFARQLPATLLWNYPTLDALGAHLAGLWDDAPDKRPAASSQILNEQTGTGDGTDSLGVSLGDLLEMSDDDAARMLRGTR